MKRARLNACSLAFAVALLLGATAAGAQDAAAKADFDYAAMPLRAGVWLDKQDGDVYAKGDLQTVTVQANADAYAVVYRIDTNGHVSVLWPRSRMDDGFVFGGHEYVLPVQGGPRLRAGDAEGEGFVEIILSRYPFDLRALELDFHHEPNGPIHDFRVVGDPFLAMNEVNYAITGLENSEDYVVTNYASYYVHREVDHPRYLCGQCHFDDGVSYDPYRDTCRLQISVDYRWSNGWWGSYGYYPVYCYPSYVYVDPWTWRPWVNFWYDPWWHCPTISVCYWNDPWYSWCDSPHYRGNSYTGQPRYRPLTPGVPADGTRTKVREYGAISPLAAAAGGDVRTKDVRDARTAYRGESRVARTQPSIDADARSRSTSGLRIREDGSVRGRDSEARSKVRHTAAGGGERAGLVPVTGRPDRNESTVGASRRDGAASPASRSDNTVRSGRTNSDSRTIRTVEPRQKSTRIWNTGRSGTSGTSTRRTEQVRPGSRSSGGSEVRDNGSGSRQRQEPKVRSDNTSRERSSSGSRNSGGGEAVRDKGSSRSSGTKSNTTRSSSGGSSGRSRGSENTGGRSRG